MERSFLVNVHFPPLNLYSGLLWYYLRDCKEELIQYCCGVNHQTLVKNLYATVSYNICLLDALLRRIITTPMMKNICSLILVALIFIVMRLEGALARRLYVNK
jgi:hypothetical protein